MSYPDENLRNEITQADSPQDFSRALIKYHDECEARIAAYFAHANPQIDCCSGCTFCCYLRVSVQAHEVFLIAHHVQQHFSQERLTALRQRLRDHRNTVASLSQIEHLTRNVRCPLLEGNQCSVYSVRPFACRRYHSSNVASCKFSYENPTDTSESRDHDEGLDEMWIQFIGLAAQAYHDLGFDSAGYELGSALDGALDNPSSRKRWKRRQKAFPGCR